jgi:hypothetical protein
MYLTAERLGSSPARNTCVPVLEAAREAASMKPASATFLAGSVPFGPRSNTCRRHTPDLNTVHKG